MRTKAKVLQHNRLDANIIVFGKTLKANKKNCASIFESLIMFLGQSFYEQLATGSTVLTTD